MDVVRPGEQQSETDHKMQGADTATGDDFGRKWRHASGWFSYEMKCVPAQPQQLIVTLFGGDGGAREFDVLVDGKIVGTAKSDNQQVGGFFDAIFSLAPELTQRKVQCHREIRRASRQRRRRRLWHPCFARKVKINKNQFMATTIHHRSGLRHEFGSRPYRQRRQRPGSRHRRLGLCTRHRRRDPRPRPQPRPAASRRLCQRRGDHHQAGPRRGEENRQGFQRRIRSSASAWTPRAARRCRWTPTASRLPSRRRFAKNPAAMAWLWKDHTGVAEAAEITALAKKMRPQYLAKCGGTYSSEWFFSKILHCLRTSPEVFNAAYSWIELADFVPAALTGTLGAGQVHRGRLRRGPQGHVERQMGRLSGQGFSRAGSIPNSAHCATGLPAAFTRLTAPWAGSPPTGRRKPASRPASPWPSARSTRTWAASAPASQPGTLVKIIGTSTCDMMIAPSSRKLADIPGLCGIVDGSILPGYFGLEAGQSAVGDIFNWLVNYIQPGGKKPARTRNSPGARRNSSPANPACSRSIGTTATARSSWTSGSPACSSARRCTRRRRRFTAR